MRMRIGDRHHVGAGGQWRIAPIVARVGVGQDGDVAATQPKTGVAKPADLHFLSLPVRNPVLCSGGCTGWYKPPRHMSFVRTLAFVFVISIGLTGGGLV